MAKYMHTINGHPAAFSGGQICYAYFYGKPNKLCSSLAEIKKERAATKAYRLSCGFSYNESDYGHLRYE